MLAVVSYQIWTFASQTGGEFFFHLVTIFFKDTYESSARHVTRSPTKLIRLVN